MTNSIEEKEYVLINELREETGAGIILCKQAIKYAKGDKPIAKAYIKAKCLAVATPSLTFDERVKRFMD